MSKDSTTILRSYAFNRRSQQWSPPIDGEPTIASRIETLASGRLNLVHVPGTQYARACAVLFEPLVVGWTHGLLLVCLL